MQMMQTEREYAEALFALAVEDQAVEGYRQALDSVGQLFEDNPDYVEFLNSPAIPLSERLQAIDEAFEGSVPEYVLFFLKVICEQGKMRMIRDCIDEFSKLAMSFSDTIAATVYSAVPLSDQQKQSLCQKLKAMTHKSMDPIYIVDPSLIGGLKIEVDGKTFDGSIKHRLGEIKDVMNA